ncbi:MAG: hypothetical protein CMP39_04330 [Rickettsiales bacterium]|nr:hypothetical protein [Rickettsiales bacterium]|tara:strand:+ start:659 stop:1924 length:1266 start_codon:yes stop_codon:yes gene_type:complete
MALPSRFLRLQSSQPYLKTETTAGSFVVPAATDAFATSEYLDLSQSYNTSSVTEVGERLLQNSSVVNYAERSTFDIPFLIKPSGSAGTAPAEDFLLQQVFGTKTVSGGASVKYTTSRVSDTFQIAQVTDVYKLCVANGCVIESANLDVSREGVLSMSCSARAQRIRYGGALEHDGGGAVSVTDSGVTATFTVGSGQVAADSLFNGMTVNVITQASGAVKNTGLVTVSNVSTSGATCTLTADTGDTFTFDSGDEVRPAFAAPTLSTNSPLSAGISKVFLGNNNATIGTASGNVFDAANEFMATSFSMSFNKNLGDPGVSELTGDLYPAASYVSQDFSVSGTVEFVTRPDKVAKFMEVIRKQFVSIGLQMGNTAGSIVKLAIPSALVTIQTTGVDGAMGGTINFELDKGTSTTDAAALELAYT